MENNITNDCQNEYPGQLEQQQGYVPIFPTNSVLVPPPNIEFVPGRYIYVLLTLLRNNEWLFLYRNNPYFLKTKHTYVEYFAIRMVSEYLNIYPKEYQDIERHRLYLKAYAYVRSHLIEHGPRWYL